MDDVYVYVADLPPGVNEIVKPCLDGYTIWISDRLSRDEAILAYYHAMGHIANNDFEKFNVNEIELEAHQRKEAV